MDAESVLHNLRIVAMVREQDKLVTGPRYCLRSPTLFRASLRWWNGEGRHTDIDNLRGLLSAAVNFVIVSYDESNQTGVSVDRLVSEIRSALKGINVLLRTYHDDLDTCARLQTLVQDTQCRLTRFRPGILDELRLGSPSTSSPSTPSPTDNALFVRTSTHHSSRAP